MNPKKILIAEDEKPLLKVLTLKLETEGYTVSTAFNGEEALKLLAESTFDLLILDLIMPKKDGFFVLSEIKRLGLTIPVIVLSNLGQDEDLKKAKELGAADYFIKSNIPLSQVVDKVKKFLPSPV